MKALLTAIMGTLLSAPVWAQSGPAVPEIPLGAAPVIVAGVLGAVMLIRSRRGKAKKD
jgi:hypothetical protein